MVQYLLGRAHSRLTMVATRKSVSQMEVSLSSVKGHRVSEVRFSGNPGVRLIFCGAYDALSEMTIGGTITMQRGTDARVLDAWQGGQWNPSTFSPVLELLGASVTSVFSAGALLTFSNAWELSVTSDYEREQGWSFRRGKNASRHITRDTA